jgi:hypothetical protein
MLEGKQDSDAPLSSLRDQVRRFATGEPGKASGAGSAMAMALRAQM